MPRAACFLFVCALLAAGCGADGGDGDPSRRGGLDLPEPDGRSLGAIAQKEASGANIVLTRAVTVLQPGKQRFAFQLADVAGKPLEGWSVALYVAATEADGTVGDDPAAGPWPTSEESAATKPPFRSQTAAADPDAPRSFYVAAPHFPLGGDWGVMVLARKGGKTLASDPVIVHVGLPGDRQPPAVGEAGVKVSTPTVASAGGDVESIDTRVPPSDMHEDDLADVFGRKPVVLVFATPALCQTKVCGPVVDIAEQVKAATGDGVAFIHMEIYEDNQVAAGERSQVKAWRLPSEPWTFVLDRRGRVAERFEGIVSVRELQAAVDRVRK